MVEAENTPEQDGSRACEPVKNPPSDPQSLLDEQKKAFADLNDQHLRLAADFENFRRRTARERESITVLANERFAVDLLEVVDNLERALKADDAHLREGIVQIQQLLTSQMARHGVVAYRIPEKTVQPGRTRSYRPCPIR